MAQSRNAPLTGLYASALRRNRPSGPGRPGGRRTARRLSLRCRHPTGLWAGGPTGPRCRPGRSSGGDLLDVAAEHDGPAVVVLLAGLGGVLAEDLPTAVLERHQRLAVGLLEGHSDPAGLVSTLAGMPAEGDQLARLPEGDGAPDRVVGAGLGLHDAGAHPGVDEGDGGLCAVDAVFAEWPPGRDAVGEHPEREVRPGVDEHLAPQGRDGCVRARAAMADGAGHLVPPRRFVLLRLGRCDRASLRACSRTWSSTSSSTAASTASANAASAVSHIQTNHCWATTIPSGARAYRLRVPRDSWRTSPAPSSTRRCLLTAGRPTVSCSASLPTGVGPLRSRAMIWRRTGSPRASKTSSAAVARAAVTRA